MYHILTLFTNHAFVFTIYFIEVVRVFLHNRILETIFHVRYMILYLSTELCLYIPLSQAKSLEVYRF